MSTQNLGRTATIILASVIPSVVLIALIAVVCYRVHRRKSRLFRRGITPIDDEEIESWKVDRPEEKELIPESFNYGGNGNAAAKQSESSNQPSDPRRHQPGNSVGSIHKPPSVIVYQDCPSDNRRMSEDQSPRSIHKRSIDLPQTPVLARAPNARPGLTDETVQGEDAFISHIKRQPSRLAKVPPTSSPRHQRSRSARGARNSFSAQGQDLWYGQGHSQQQPSPRHSTDTFSRAVLTKSRGRSQTHTYTRSTPPPLTSYDDDFCLGGLSPRPPIHRSEIGRAIG